MILILAALDIEINSLKKVCKAKRVKGVNGHSKIFIGKCFEKELMMAVTKMGKQNAKKAGEYVFENYSFDAVINAGFAGSAQENFRVGDVVICRSCKIANDQEFSTGMLTETIKSDERLLRIARELEDKGDYNLTEGDCFTALRIITEPEMKKQIGKLSDVSVIDIEGYWFAAASRDRNLPFLAIKSISDAVDEKMTDFNFLFEEKLTMLGKFFRYVLILLMPSRLKAILRMRKNCSVAERNLVDVLCGLIPKVGVD